MQFPMLLSEERTIHTGCSSREQVRERLSRWAERYGFVGADSDDDGLAFKRGSHWQALYTFDIRKVPTVVRITLGASEGAQVSCRLSCGSWLQFAAPGDQKRLAEQFDLLEACLKGALP